MLEKYEKDFDENEFMRSFMERKQISTKKQALAEKDQHAQVSAMDPYRTRLYPPPQNERMHHEEDSRIHHKTHIGCSAEMKAGDTKRLDDECTTKKDRQRQRDPYRNFV